MATPRASMTRAQFALVSTAAVSFSFLWSVLCNLVIEYMQTGGQLRYLRDVTLGRGFLLFLLGSVLIWCVFLLLWSLTGRLRVPTAVLIAAAVPLAYANYKKVTLRLEPLYPSDFGFASNVGFLRQMVSPSAIVTVVGVSCLLALVTLLLGRILGRTWRRTNREVHPRRWRIILVGRVVVAALSLAVLTSAAQFNQDGNPVRGAYEATGAHWAFWYQKLNYRNNGFVGGMLYNLDVPAMEKPADYSAETMRQITQRYSSAAERLNKDLDPDALDDVNIVLVLSEAFSDPENLEGIEYAEDPIPHTRELMRTTTSGSMLAQLFGGGTANMEFEALTGMSLSQFNPQMQTPYQMLVANYEAFPSAVAHLAANGHRPVAIHPYMTSMYKRESVYPVLGFDEFIGEREMHDTTTIDKSDFISDRSAFGQVRREIEASDDPLFVNLVTMQNHYPMQDIYEDPIPVKGLTGDAKKEAEGYGRGLKHTDDALRTFLQQLQASDEKTAVVLYGDHLPAFWPESVRERNGDLTMKQTPFFLWANTPLAIEATVPTTSPIYFLPMLYEAMGAQVPPYYALLLQLREEIPAMEQGIYLDPTGRDLEENALSPRAKALLRDYRLVQYDLSVGNRYSQDELFYPERTASAAAE